MPQNGHILRSNIMPGDNERKIVCTISLEELNLTEEQLNKFIEGGELDSFWCFKGNEEIPNADIPREHGASVSTDTRGTDVVHLWKKNDISQWLTRYKTCPNTRKPLDFSMLKPITLAELVKAKKLDFIINTIAVEMTDKQRYKLLIHAKDKGFTNLEAILITLQQGAHVDPPSTDLVQQEAQAQESKDDGMTKEEAFYTIAVKRAMEIECIASKVYVDEENLDLMYVLGAVPRKPNQLMHSYENLPSSMLGGCERSDARGPLSKVLI
jgi:hypothetical protein